MLKPCKKLDLTIARPKLDYVLSVHANVPTRTAIGIAGMDRIVDRLLRSLAGRIAV